MHLLLHALNILYTLPCLFSCRWLICTPFCHHTPPGKTFHPPGSVHSPYYPLLGERYIAATLLVRSSSTLARWIRQQYTAPNYPLLGERDTCPLPFCKESPAAYLLQF